MGLHIYTFLFNNREGSYTAVATDVAIPRRSKASSTAKITEKEMPATTTRYYRIVITYNNLPEINQTRDLTAQFNTGFTIKPVSKTIAEAHPDGDYLKDICDELDASGNCTSALKDTIFGNTEADWKNYISKVYFHNTLSPTYDGRLYGSAWDASQGQNGSVMAWLTDPLMYMYYESLSDCNNDSSTFDCESISSTTYYAAVNTSNVVKATYETLEECNEHEIYVSSM